MQIKCIAVGKSMPAWVTTAVSEYQKRLQHTWPLTWIEVPIAKRSKNSQPQQYMAKEAIAINKHIQPTDIVIATVVTGKVFTTGQFAAQCSEWADDKRNLCVLIGGPDGLDPALIETAHCRWSLSALTLPHPLVRVVIAEQFYRAWSVTSGHPYHRD